MTNFCSFTGDELVAAVTSN